MKKKEWREAQKRCKENKERLYIPETPPATPDTPPEPAIGAPARPVGSSRYKEAARKRRRNTLKTYRLKIEELREKMRQARRRNVALRMKISRAKNNESDRNRNLEETPIKRIEKFMAENDEKSIKKRLTYQEVLIDEVKRKKGFDFLRTGQLQKYRGMRRWVKVGPLRKDVQRGEGKNAVRSLSRDR